MPTGEQVVLLDGLLRLEVDEGVFDRAPGDCARVDVDQPHSFRNIGPVPGRYLVAMRNQV